jgi:hypothetical protein
MPADFADAAADLRCYPLLFCRRSLSETGAVSKACMTGHAGIAENSETARSSALRAAAVAAICRWFAAGCLLK